jgi:Histidine kinase-, DNA gyrase B-, and HSP90-like ATPase
MVLVNCKRNLQELSRKACCYAALILLVELGLILLTYFLLAQAAEKSLQHIMQERASQVQNVIEMQLAAFEFNIRRNAAFTRGNGLYISAVTARDIIQFSRFPNRNSVEAYDFFASLPAQDVDKFIEFCDKEILSGCYLKEIDQSTAPVVTFKPASPRPIHYPVLFIIPLGDEVASVQQYIGLDLGGGPIIKNLLTCPRDGVILTERINLARKTENPNSFGLIMGHAVDKNPSSPAYNIWGYHTVTIRPEIRNPLNVIQHLVMYTLKKLNHVHEPSVRRMSVDKETLETAISDLNIVCNQCAFLEHIVSDVLVIQKLEANMVRLNTQQCSISDILKDLQDAIKQKSEENPNVVLQFHCEPGAFMSVDQFRLKQILLNFLSNAMKYTEQGSITVTAEQTEDTTVFAVKDTGKGIRGQDRQKIFTAFTHVASDDAARHGSNGLGLYLCKLLANCMGGSVGFTSSSAGSTFWIKLSNQTPARLEDV